MHLFWIQKPKSNYLKMAILPLVGESCQLLLRGLQRSVTIGFVFQAELCFELVSVVCGGFASPREENGKNEEILSLEPFWPNLCMMNVYFPMQQLHPCKSMLMVKSNHWSFLKNSSWVRLLPVWGKNGAVVMGSTLVLLPGWLERMSAQKYL